VEQPLEETLIFLAELGKLVFTMDSPLEESPGAVVEQIRLGALVEVHITQEPMRHQQIQGQGAAEQMRQHIT
jgi:hypothetical protein